jgi:hypothetical protein
LDLTAKGRSLLADETGIQEIPPRRGGLAHEFWKHRIADELRAKGLKVEVGAPLKTGGTVDILVQTKDGPRAIEIETGSRMRRRTWRSVRGRGFRSPWWRRTGRWRSG